MRAPAERQCRDVAADLITLLVPVGAESMTAVIAYSKVAANRSVREP